MGENGKDSKSFILVKFGSASQFQVSMQNVSREQILSALETMRVMVDEQIRRELAQQAQRRPGIIVPELAIRQ